jgi:predicted RNA-binding protein YlxR (DUF448 family)
MCVVCRARFAQPELARVVRAPEADGGALTVDLPRPGRRPRSGRGTYIGARAACWRPDGALRRLEAALDTTLTEAERAQLGAVAAALPDDGPPAACPVAAGGAASSRRGSRANA